MCQRRGPSAGHDDPSGGGPSDGDSSGGGPPRSARSRYRSRIGPDGSIAPELRGDRRRERTRRRLMEATARLVAAPEGDEVSVAEIAAEAGVTPGTFYNYFDSRDAALAAYVDDLALGVRRAGDALPDEVHPAVRLGLAVRLIIDQIVGDPGIGAVIVAIGARDRRIHALFAAPLTRDIERGVALGDFAPEAAGLARVTIPAVVVAALEAWVDGVADSDMGDEVVRQCLGLLGVARPAADGFLAEQRPTLPTTEG